MGTMIAILVFGIIVILILFAFGIIKLQPVSKERVCLCNNPADDEGIIISCKMFNDILADFRERRNEFWNSLGQFTVIIAIITLLVILLIMDKISSEAALPVITGLGSFGLGKTVISFRNNISPGENPRNEPKDTKAA